MEENQIQARLRHVAGIILIAVLLLLAVGIGVAAFLVNSMVEVTNSQMRAETEEYKSRLNKQISSDFQILTTMSSFLEFSDVEQADNFAQILDESSLRNDFVTMAYFPVDNTGIVAILGDPVRTSVQVTDMQPEVQDVVYRTWNGETVLSYLFESELTREKIFVYGIPVEKNGQVVGSLIASDQLEIFSDILSGDTVLGGNGHIHMINTEGRFLIRSQNAIVQEDIETIFEGPYFSDEEAERVQAALAAQETIYTSFHYKGHSYQALLQPVGINNWYMLCVNSMQESSGIYRIVMVIAVTFVGALLLMVILLAYGYRLTRHSNQELHAMAFQDPLTGGDNLRSFMLRLTQTTPQSGEVNVVALNVHQFKFINEIFGRERADRLLCHIHQQLSGHLLPEEFCCRDNADRFFAVLRGTDAGQVAERLNQIVEEICRTALVNHSSDYRVMMYCGMLSAAECAAAPQDINGAMTRALFALERAKNANLSTVWIYDAELHKKEEIDNYVQSHMHQALQDREFCMYLQPKIDLRTGRLGGAEALVRWLPGNGRMLYPDQFIPLFEANGFSVSLDLYMVDCACRQLRAWMDQGIEPVPLSVNQSKLLFFEADYIPKLQQIIQQYNIPAHWITLEILEGLALENAEELNARIEQLRKIGFHISMDDFGSGYSSLNTLSRLHIDELKLDRGFLMEVVNQGNIRSRIIMEQVVQMAKRLGICVVVEGVETRENEELIRTLGCDFGQGYYYSKPIDTDAFTARFWGADQGKQAEK